MEISQIVNAGGKIGMITNVGVDYCEISFDGKTTEVIPTWMIENM